MYFWIGGKADFLGNSQFLGKLDINKINTKSFHYEIIIIIILAYTSRLFKNSVRAFPPRLPDKVYAGGGKFFLL